MSTENAAAEGADTATTETVNTEQQVETRNYESEAREMGWVPQAEFRGPADKWKPADKFVEDGEKILPIVRAENKKLREQLRLVTDDFSTRTARLEKMHEATRKQQQADYERQINEIKAAQVKAVEAGDTAEFKRLDAQRDKLKPPEEIVVPDTGAATHERQEADFKRDNPWYGVDEDMTSIAIGYSNKLARESNNTLPLADNLAKTAAYMRQKYPALYGGQAKQANGHAHAAVDGGGLGGPSPQKKEGLADKLPAEAKAQADKDIAAGLYKTREDWAKVYFG